MARSHQNQIEGMDAAVRAGRIAEVRLGLRNVAVARVPKGHRLAYASLCRRVGLPELGLRFLARAVREGQASAAERAEYGVLLQRIGAIDEAFKMLFAISLPEALLYRSYCHFNRWEYREGVPLLREYALLEAKPYSRLVGAVNLCAALVSTGEKADAFEELERALSIAREGGYLRLEGNLHEIRAQAYLNADQDSKAREDLEKARTLLGGDEVAVAKWLTVVQARSLGSADPIREFRQRAREARDWEALRHADLQILRLEFDPQLFHYHLFGSPWIGYRDVAQRTLGRMVECEHFDLGGGGRLIDVSSGEVEGGKPLPPDGKLHRALGVLTSDFYRAIAPGAMFSALFKGEYYDPFTSPNRVHQVLHRLRDWCASERLPLVLTFGRDGYRLRPSGPVTLRKPYIALAPRQLQLRKLRAEFGHTEFAARALASKLELSEAEARAVIEWAREEGYLERFGAGPSTRYRLSIPAIQAA